MTKEQVFKKAIYDLHKNDFAIRYVGKNNFCKSFYFFHLSSVYNGILDIENNGNATINYQYHPYTKKLEKLLNNFIKACKLVKSDYMEKELAYFEQLSKALFDAKYSIAVDIHVAEPR